MIISHYSVIVLPTGRLAAVPAVLCARARARVALPTLGTTSETCTGRTSMPRPACTASVSILPSLSLSLSLPLPLSLSRHADTAEPNRGVFRLRGEKAGASRLEKR